MSGSNNNGYAENRRLLLGVGDLYFNGVFVGNLKGAVTLKVNRKYAYQRAGNNIAEQRGECISEDVTLEAEVCDIKLSQLRIAFGVNQSVDTATAKQIRKREVILLSGFVNTALAETPVSSTCAIYSLDRKTTYTSGTHYKFSGSGIERVSGSTIAAGTYVIAEYSFSDSGANSMRFGGESKPVNVYQMDYTCLDSTGKLWQISFFKAMTATDFSIAFHDFEKGTYTTHNVMFKALVDVTKPEGQNMMEIIQEDATS
jgi:hypothetical protein